MHRLLSICSKMGKMIFFAGSVFRTIIMNDNFSPFRFFLMSSAIGTVINRRSLDFIIIILVTHPLTSFFFINYCYLLHCNANLVWFFIIIITWSCNDDMLVGLTLENAHHDFHAKQNSSLQHVNYLRLESISVLLQCYKLTA